MATLLRGNLIASVHAPTPEVRARKNVLRQRLFLVKMRTMVRNRVHTLLARQRGLQRPQFSDAFGTKAKHWMSTLELPSPDGELLKEDLTMHKVLTEHIDQLHEVIVSWNHHDPATERLMSLPGVGQVLGALIASEVDGIERFPSATKLCAYAGLVPTTYASGGKVAHGRMLVFCNRWLKWAFIEAAWVSVGCSGYFGSLYRQHRARGKGANVAITIVARRLCRICWQVLKQGRDYSEHVPKLTLSPVASYSA